MALATYSDNPWICSVYYVVDDTLQIYFITKPSSKHCQNIAKNPFVACAIAASDQKVTEKKAGVQLEGKASLVTDEKEVVKALALWNKINPGFEKIINRDNIKNGTIQSKVYKVVPTRVKFFNESLYGPEGYREFIL